MADRHPLHARHRLARHLYDTARARQLDDVHTGHAGAFADAVIELGWRPPAQVIETVEGLDELPAGSVIRTMPDHVRGPHTWVCGGRGLWANGVSIYVSRTIMRNYGPRVTVLYVPAEDGDTE
ncbi:hypothetical protein [Nocardia asiatica]|uniref:hypothetical protein n=1 Tax=Nocardia asiatica TaxID=209252 RepID=UPI0024570B1D|nr:hypothetical protein [Nocardia asiatica]